jgi:hypothetical protein
MPRKKRRITCIRNGKIIMAPSQMGIQKRHSAESKKKLSDKLKGRKEGIRKGKTKKPTTLLAQLIADYNKIKASKSEAKELKNWFKKYSSELSKRNNEELFEQLGILTDYEHQRRMFQEIGVDAVLFDENGDSDNGSFEDEADYYLELDILLEEWEEKVEWFKKEGYTDEEIEESAKKYFADYIEEEVEEGDNNE